MKLFLFDDGVADGWHPFALTRPCGELRFGRWLLRERLEAFAGAPAAGHLTRSWLRDFREPDAPGVVSASAQPEDEDRLLISSRAVPDPGARFEPPAGPATLWMGQRPLGWWLPAGTPSPDPDSLRSTSPLDGAADLPLPGRPLEAVWELVARNPERLAEDLRHALGPPGGSSDGISELPRGVERIGSEPLRLGRDVRIEPGVLIDLRQGPVLLEDGVEVRTGARLTGPLHAGRRSRLLGGPLAALSAGPYSYLRGEVEECVVLGHSNKSHDGFLGHAYLGRWVNLGAMTTNSDLKNNYGTVRMGPPGREVDTGLLKLGCLLGDHVKTGIGTLIATGSVIGAGSNLFGTAMPPRWVPPFSWGAGEALSPYRREPFLRTAEIVLGRREVAVDEGVRAWLAAAWEEGRRQAEEGWSEAGEGGHDVQVREAAAGEGPKARDGRS